jgi:hypothetical protein
MSTDRATVDCVPKVTAVYSRMIPRTSRFLQSRLTCKLYYNWEFWLLGYKDTQPVESQLTVWRNTATLSSGSTNKPKTKSAWNMQQAVLVLTCYSKTTVVLVCRRAAWRYIPADIIFLKHRCDNLEVYIIIDASTVFPNTMFLKLF